MLKFIKQASTGKTRDYLLKNFKYEADIEKTGKVSDILSSNQHILVQVVKEPISTKGPRISSELFWPDATWCSFHFQTAFPFHKK